LPGFIHTDLDGIRLTRLADKSRMTPQALGELVDDLVELGYLRRVPDPTDGRAKLIVFTGRGREALHWGLDAVAGVEAELAEVLGRSRARRGAGRPM
jgi:DNA-binding MarR family transcriptional regulator